MDNELACLEAADRADFDEVLEQALADPDVRAALRRPTSRITEEQLRSGALAAADGIAAAAAAEYAALRRLRAPGARGTGAVRGPGGSASVGHGLLTALAVLTPVLSAGAAVIFLLLGFALRLTGTRQPLADALVATGWVALAVAVLAAAAAVSALFVAAVRQRAADEPDVHDVQRARAAWREALLERGFLPFLRTRLRSSAGAGPSPLPSTSTVM
ncbi:hypothetical protein [Streptomyces sp. NPDC050504]|uniref:hypothetical protein n=1 Tax=Streptomyces sp. NPDC050504 TaxID=3365618 RepID=UPI003791923C